MPPHTKHKEKNTMKKTYISPQAATIELGTLELIAVSILGNPNQKNYDEYWADSYDSNEYRSDWENIWANM